MDAVQLLTKMVEIQSLSEEEHNVASFLVEQMQQNGLKSYLDEVGNAIGIKEGNITDTDKIKEIILLGHMDTVPGNIPVRQEGDILYGRGTVDAKGPLATFIAATIAAQIPENMRIIVIGAVEEEISTSKGAHHIKNIFSPPQACIIGEPSSWDSITLGYKGQFIVKYHLEQGMEHTAGAGSSVAEKAVEWWNKILEYTRDFNKDHNALFNQFLPTLRHIQTSSDGLTEIAQAIVGIRLPMDVDVDNLTKIMRDFADGANVKLISHEPAYKCGKNNGLVRVFLRSIRHSQGKPTFKSKTGTSDMNVVGPKWNCPIVAYGPGDSKLDHTPNEHISINEYLKAIDTLKFVLENSNTI